MFSTRKRISRLNKRLTHLRRRHSDLHAIIDIFKTPSKEIAVLLIELLNRHSLTITCITHFCQLLRLLKVPNAPPSFDSIESLTLSTYQSTTFPTQSIICPSCHQRSSNTKRCTNTHDCASKHSFICLPPINYTFAGEPQL
ncbi:unnamed protein product [Rotaria sordida]|uniref:Uncharacterized protein n=1 Tax=Rotaria sordida TaxID=392033 RepID=A0A819XMV5_9BILA|nr:unnamed protein product [Rotaria sordida]CAF4144326.1 unnamed protein product [Rotaria sordida]